MTIYGLNQSFPSNARLAGISSHRHPRTATKVQSPRIIHPTTVIPAQAGIHGVTNRHKLETPASRAFPAIALIHDAPIPGDATDADDFLHGQEPPLR